MKIIPSIKWIYVAGIVAFINGRSLDIPRSPNDIALDFQKFEKLGQTDSLIESLKAIAQNTHSCGIKEIPRLRRFFLSNTSVTCNDGSPAGYFMRKSYGSTKWIVFLESGWFCFDQTSCSHRWQTDNKFMTSNDWPESRQGQGILSWNPEENPYYFHSNMVFIPYCSSDAWSGTSTDGEYSFMGALIVEEVLKELVPKGLKHARKLLFTGSSAGGTGVLVNLDRVANLMSELAPRVEVRGIADSGWFVDSPHYKKQPCLHPHSCNPVDAIKKGTELWKGRVPEGCQQQYPESEHWKCYFGYRMYPTLKTPLYVFQYLFDEAQIMVDNVFDVRSGVDNSASIWSKTQWQYLHHLGQRVRSTLENVSAVFSPACLSHEVLQKPDWHNTTVNNIKLAQSIYCWENSYGNAKCAMTTRSKDSIGKPLGEEPLGDQPKSKDKAERRRRKRRRRKKGRKKKKKNKNKNKNKRKRQTRHRKRDRRHTGNCPHHVIDPCPLPQCNKSCPKYRNKSTDAEMDIFKLFVRFGLEKTDIAKLLGSDIDTVESMDYNTISTMIYNWVNHKT